MKRLLPVFAFLLICGGVLVTWFLWFTKVNFEAMFEAKPKDTVFLRKRLGNVLGAAQFTVFRVNRDTNCYFATTPSTKELTSLLKALSKPTEQGTLIQVTGEDPKWIVYTEFQGEVVIGVKFGGSSPKLLLDEFPKRVEDRRQLR